MISTAGPDEANNVEILHFFVLKLFFRQIIRISASEKKEIEMYKNKVEICGVNTSKLKILTEREKDELLRCAKGGDTIAREQLVNGNLKLVLSVVQRFTGRRENLDDIFQVGCIGLIKAIDNFNTEVGVKFSTYAVPMNIPM